MNELSDNMVLEPKTTYTDKNLLMNNIKKIVLYKGSIVWKLPLILAILNMFTEYFVGMFFRLQLSFTMLRKDSDFISAADAGNVYIKTMQETFYSLGIGYIVYEIFALMIVLLFAFIIDRFSTEKLGIKLSVKSVFLFTGGVIAAFCVVSCINLMLYFNGNLQFVGLNPSITNITRLIIFQGVLYLLVAFQEELFSRAYFISNLRWMETHGTMGRLLIISISSITFAILHLSNLNNLKIENFIGIVNIGFIAIIFCIYFLHYNDLWLLIGAHFGWNFFMGPFYGSTVSNIETLSGKSFLKVTLVGHQYLTGGGFGPEGSLITTMTLLLVLLGIYQFSRSRKSEIKRV